MSRPFHITLCEDSLKTVLILLLCYGLAIGMYLSTQRNYRRREEHGSAQWGSPVQVNRKYADKVPTRNKILTQNVSVGLDGRKHRRNLNTLVCGGSGAGKTRFYAKPNLCQANSSYVVLDPKGELLFWKSILFIIPYVSIRTFSGGFHFKSAKLCFLVTNMILFFSLIITKKMICIGRSTIFLVLILLASLTVFLLSPIDSDARKLTSSETSAFRRVARYLVIAFLAIDLVLYCLGIFSAAYPIGMGIALTAALQLPCCIRVKS